MINFLKHFREKPFGKESRLIFQNMDKAPKAPENFKTPEKQGEAAMLNEVASQTPSEIYSDTVHAGGTIAARYTGNTTILAGLANINPLGGNGGDGGTTTQSDDENHQSQPIKTK